MKHAPNFKTHKDHDKWVLENAEYFTVVVTAYRARVKIEVPTLERAREAAQGLVEDKGTERCLIYAVCGVYSAYVETVSKGD